jgi:hypothetical protein
VNSRSAAPLPEAFMSEAKRYIPLKAGKTKMSANFYFLFANNNLQYEHNRESRQKTTSHLSNECACVRVNKVLLLSHMWQKNTSGHATASNVTIETHRVRVGRLNLEVIDTFDLTLERYTIYF